VGDSPSFSQKGNLPPVASNVRIQLVKRPNGLDYDLVGSYNYTDSEGDAETGTVLRWLFSNTPGGQLQPLQGTDGQSNISTAAFEFLFGKEVVFEVVPASTGGNGSTTATQSNRVTVPSMQTRNPNPPSKQQQQKHTHHKQNNQPNKHNNWHHLPLPLSQRGRIWSVTDPLF
jgi:hypothetical protein